MKLDLFSRVEPYVPGLKQYCFILTKNKWDAEDLIQDVLTKVYRSLQHNPDRAINKAFLQKIAKNAWIDKIRKNQATQSALIFDEDLYYQKDAVSEMSIREMFEQLSDDLNPRQMVLILLVDIFQFTASETAQLLRTTVGAVKEGLKRARNKLKTLASKSNGNGTKIDNNGKKRKYSEGNGDSAHFLSEKAFEQFLSAFRAGDPEEICRTYLSLIEHGNDVVQASASKERIYFTFRDPNGHLISFFQEY